MSERTALVTGTSGYLGSRIAQHLALGGFRVVERRGRRDLAELPSFDPVAGVDVVVHAAFGVDFSPAGAPEPESESVCHTRRVAGWAESRGVPHLVFLSAAGVLGVSATPRVRNEENLGGTDPTFEGYRATRYIQDKLAAERVLATYPGTVTTLYLTTVYGPGMKGPARETLAHLEGLSPAALVPPGGTSFLDLRDLLEGIDLVIANRPAGRFVLSSGNVAYRELYLEAAEILAVAWRKRVLVLPRGTRHIVEALAAQLPSLAPARSILSSSFGFKYYSCERARRLLGFTAKRALRAALETALVRPGGV